MAEEERRLRVLDYAWHQAHAYRLHALPADFWFLRTFYHSRLKVLWDSAQRPQLANFMGGVDDADISPDRFDLAILHLDQWCDRIAFRGLGFRRARVLARGIPQVVIMHGTPDDERNRLRILQLIGDLPVVCNSRQAAAEWGNEEVGSRKYEVGARYRLDRYGRRQFRTIIHGYDVDEFWSEPAERRAVEAATICSGGQLSRVYHGIPLLERLRRDVPLAWYGPAGNREWKGDYWAYRQMLAGTLVYFSPTRRAPMPGARTEAMLSGCCVVTVPGNDVERFIQDGVTGFIVEDYAEARDRLRWALAHPVEAWVIGQAGREAARWLFGKERYVEEWMGVVESMK